MISVNNAKVLAAEEGLTILYAAALPIDVAFAMKKLLKEYNPLLQNAKKGRLELFQKYGEVETETQNIKILPQNVDLFQTEMAQLLNAEVELRCEPITSNVDWLPKNIILTTEQLSAMEDFIKLY